MVWQYEHTAEAEIRHRMEQGYNNICIVSASVNYYQNERLITYIIYIL